MISAVAIAVSIYTFGEKGVCVAYSNFDFSDGCKKFLSRLTHIKMVPNLNRKRLSLPLKNRCSFEALNIKKHAAAC